MARIFLSHSSKDNAVAVALRDFLVGEGWDDLFLDIDADKGIAAAERWERALSEAVNRCEAVVFLVSRNWLASRWCLREYNLAMRLNKRLFGVVVDDLPTAELPVELTGTWQVVRLGDGQDHRLFRVRLPDDTEEHVTLSRRGLAALKTGLSRAGLDPRFFAWPPADDPERPPYRGMRPLEAEDAGIFFGREAPVIAALDRLRGLAEGAPPRLLAILGASGAGKSSFLRAGILPRLARDDRHFLPLPVVRPEHAALSGDAGLMRCLEGACAARGLKRSRAEIRAALDDAEGCAALLADIAEAARPPRIEGEPASPAPALVLPLDQGEELFLAEGREEAERLLALLAGLMRLREPCLIVLITIRSDAYEQLQTAPALEGLAQATLSLPPVPKGAYQTIIEGPAARLKDTPRAVVIEPALTAALLADIEAGGAKDALPLLAFTLERLYSEHGGDGDLRLDEYRQLGGIRGSIEAAVERALAAADKDPAVPRERGARLALLRRALIPWLAGIDPESGLPRRRVARLSEIPEEARPLVRHLVAERLLSTEQSFGLAEDGGLRREGEATVEPAHEALLRQWGLLQGWLEEDFAALATLEGVKRAARDWEANGRDEAWLAHRAGRLEDAGQLRGRADLARILDATDLAYLEAARTADTAARNRELEEARKLAEARKRIARRTLAGAIAAGLLAVMAGGLGWYGIEQARLADARSAEVKEGAARLAINAAETTLGQGFTEQAAVLLLDAAQTFDEQTAPDEIRIGFDAVNEAVARRTTYPLPVGSAAYEGQDALYFVDPATKDILRFDGSGDPSILAKGKPDDAPVRSLGWTRVGIVLLHEDGTVQRIDTDGTVSTVARLQEPEQVDGRTYEELADWQISIAPDGMVVVERGYQETGKDTYGTFLQLVDGSDGSSLAQYRDSYIGGYLSRADGPGVLDLEEGQMRVVRHNGALDLVASPMTEAELLTARVEDCFVKSLSHVPESIPEIDFNPGTAFDRRCVADEDGVLITTFYSTSAGTDRQDEWTDSEGETTSLREMAMSVSGYRFDETNPSWAAPEPDQYRLGMIVNRDVFVFDAGSLYLLERHAEVPPLARFLGDGELAVVEANAGRIVVYDLDYYGPRDMLSTSDEEAVVTAGGPVALLHGGTCTGYRLPAETVTPVGLPDGGAITFGGSTQTTSNGAPTITVEDQSGTRTITLGSEEACVALSPDADKLIVLPSLSAYNPPTIYDLAEVLKAGGLDGANGDRMPEYVSSAFFVGSTGDIITAGRDYTVKRWHKRDGGWSSEVVYNGTNAVFYAEPDVAGNRLIFLEDTGSGMVQAALYSISARKRWLELGSEYKWLGTAYTEDGDIVISNGASLSRLLRLRTLTELVEETAAVLPPHCQPASEGDYATSPCWPAWLTGGQAAAR